MTGFDADDPLGLAVAMLDDLFGGRARLHVVSGSGPSLVPVANDEPVLEGPGPLHEVLHSPGAVTFDVDENRLARWDVSYGSWLQRGACRLTAARIEGGGAVVGVISVVRSSRSTVPAIEDADLLAALAMRFGRTVAVPLVLASAEGAPRRDDVPPGTASAQTEVAPVIERAVEGDVEVIVTHEPEAELPESPDPGAEGGGFDGVALLRRSIESALRLQHADLDVMLDEPSEIPGLEVRAGISAAMARLVPLIGSAQPPGGLCVSVGNSGEEWRIELRPRELIDGWPTVPELDSVVHSEIRAIGCEVALQATAEHGWVIELAIPGLPSHNGDETSVEANEATEATNPEVETAESPPGPAIDLMAASLGDTRNMIVLALDLSGRVLFCNDELAQRLGGGIADLLGRPLHSHREPRRSWAEFEELLASLEQNAMVQATLAWPYGEGSDQQVRWTLTRSTAGDLGPVTLCIGVDTAHDPIPAPS